MVVSREVVDDVDIPVLKLYHANLGNVHSYNYLGVIVDDKLVSGESLEYKVQ